MAWWGVPIPESLVPPRIGLGGEHYRSASMHEPMVWRWVAGEGGEAYQDHAAAGQPHRRAHQETQQQAQAAWLQDHPPCHASISGAVPLQAVSHLGRGTGVALLRLLCKSRSSMKQLSDLAEDGHCSAASSSTAVSTAPEQQTQAWNLLLLPLRTHTAWYPEGHNGHLTRTVPGHAGTEDSSE